MFQFFKKSHELAPQHLYERALTIGAKVHKFTHQYVIQAPLGTRWSYNNHHELIEPYKSTESQTIELLMVKIQRGLVRCETVECISCQRTFEELEEGDTVQLNIPKDAYYVAL